MLKVSASKVSLIASHFLLKYTSPYVIISLNPNLCSFVISLIGSASVFVPAQEQWKEVITHVVAETINREKVFQWTSTFGKSIVFGCFGKQQSYTRCATSVSKTKRLQTVFSKSGKMVTLTRQSIGAQFLPLPQHAVLIIARDLRYQTSVRCLTAGCGISL